MQGVSMLEDRTSSPPPTGKARPQTGVGAPLGHLARKTGLDSFHTLYTQIIPGGLKPRCEKQNMQLFRKQKNVHDLGVGEDFLNRMNFGA